MAGSAGPLQREIRVLFRALLVFLVALIVVLLALAMSMLNIGRPAATADAALSGLGSFAAEASRADLQARLELLRGDNGIGRIEVYRGQQLYAAVGELLPSAQVFTRVLPGGGRMCIYYDDSRWIGGRRTGLTIAACATLATMMGLLLFILYVPKFTRPLEEMLDHAQQLGDRQRGDDDARYLVHSFREAVERIQQQARELDDLRHAAGARGPDIRELSAAIHRSFSSGFVALDAAGNIVALNDAGRTMLGLPREADGAAIELAMLPAAFAEVVRTSLVTRTALTRREVVLDDVDALVGVTTVPLFDGESFLGLFALFTDLTTFRAMEGRLRDLENLVGLGQVSAGIAHEFRNSLFTILGYLRLAQKSATTETSARIRSAESEAQRLAGAVDTLLNFARPLTIRTQRLRLDLLALEIIERAEADAPDVVFTTNMSEVEINGDRDLLVRAIENIVRNAIDAVREQHPDGGGRVTADVTAEPHPRIAIADNGVGVDAEAAARLLLPFQSAKPHGFGLGLPLARKIALHHGGTLTLTGTPGSGATVTIEFFA
jgi:signal transduction histidine kinase